MGYQRATVILEKFLQSLCFLSKLLFRCSHLKDTGIYLIYSSIGCSISFVLKKFNLRVDSRIGRTENLGI